MQSKISEFAPQFSDEEFHRRHALVRRRMAEADIDCLLVPVSENITYLTNLSMLAFGAYLLLPASGEPAIVTNNLLYRSPAAQSAEPSVFGAYSGGEATVAIDETSVVNDVVGVDMPNMVPEIGRRLLQFVGNGKARVGVVGRDLDGVAAGGGLMGITGPMALAPMMLPGLQQLCPNVEFVDGTRVLLKARRFKSPEEIESVRNATAIADACCDAIRHEMTKSNCREADLYAAYWDTLYRQGGAGSWWFMVCSNPTDNPRTHQYHVHPYDRAIDHGDIVMAEILPVWRDGYVGHSEACFVLGEPKQKAIYERVNAACLTVYEAVLDSLRPGATSPEIMGAADAPLLSAGLLRSAPVVYGVGLFGIEPPPIVGVPIGPPDEELDILEPNMTVVVISHVFDPDTQVTVRTGSTHLITDSGSECFNGDSVPKGMALV